jgi:hypothetical protein
MRVWEPSTGNIKAVVPIGLTPNDPMGGLGGTARAPLPAISCVLRRVSNIKPVLGPGGPGCPCHRADDPWHLAPILSERVGQVKPEPRGVLLVYENVLP